MRILLVHNYTQGCATGGEGHVFEDEARILQENGHEVQKLFCSNSEATDASLTGKIRAFWLAPWSSDGYARMAKAIQAFKPDVVHVHNFFLILSSSIFKAARDHGVPVVVTLHNYRMVSPCSQLLRNGSICELCVGRNPWRILLYRCYKNSFWASLLRYRIYYLSRKIHRWERYVDAFVVLTAFGKAKMKEGGLPEDRLFIVPNCTTDPLGPNSAVPPGKGALFIGRLSAEKGMVNLIEAWRRIDYPLTIVGDGNLRSQLERTASSQVRFVGEQKIENVIQFLQDCAFLVIPSIWYEGLPLVLVEAMAQGRAVAVAGHGAMGAIVQNGQTGVHFKPGDVSDLREKVQQLIANPDLVHRLGLEGRKVYLSNFTPQKHYEALMETYKTVFSRRDKLCS